MTQKAISELQQQIYELTVQLNTLRKTAPRVAVRDYTFATQTGAVTLGDLFAGRERLLLIHNMGQGCRYCTLWADGFNGLVDHLESAMAVVLVSNDCPDLQREFANSRGWRFRLASHGGGEYMVEQSVLEGAGNMPGAVVYERDGDGDGDAIYRKSACVFGPGDQYCTMWSLLGLAGMGEDEWTPQFRYWRQPAQLDDGGENVQS
jgi:predicted dithiol-disulfide oxidoreductase (DUF899 family)